MVQTSKIEKNGVKIGIFVWLVLIIWLAAFFYLPHFFPVEEYSLAYPYSLAHRLGSILYLIPLFLAFVAPKVWTKKRLIPLVLVWLVIGVLLAEFYMNTTASWRVSLTAALNVSYTFLVPGLIAGSSLILYALSVRPIRSEIFTPVGGFLFGVFFLSALSFIFGGCPDCGPTAHGNMVGFLLIGPFLAVLSGIYFWRFGRFRTVEIGESGKKIGAFVWPILIICFLFFIPIGYPYRLVEFEPMAILYLIPIFLMLVTQNKRVRKWLFVLILVWAAMGVIFSYNIPGTIQTSDGRWTSTNALMGPLVSCLFLVPGLLAGSSLILYALFARPSRSEVFTPAGGFLLGVSITAAVSFISGKHPVMFGILNIFLIGLISAIICGFYFWQPISRGRTSKLQKATKQNM